ncbi:MAG: cytochrome c-type biosis protein CcmF, partial [Bacteroidota bacterium]|nr:cytochrome c-type biosis protein CcmF [Bacteroidota bacterium]
MIGKSIIYVSFALNLLAIAYYYLSIKSDKFLKFARYAYFGTALGIIITSLFLLNNIFSHNFQFAYVWEYSSKELPGFLLLSSFYAGQEGSFLLWALMIAIFGLILMPFSRKYGYEPVTMGLFSFILAFILSMLVAKNPFMFIWEKFPGVAAGFMPENGKGLNPVLENYWITIHPPILFAGFAAMSIPFALALTGLIKKEYTRWVNIAIPWTLVSTALLGAGIMLGGFWAYETLGWGGFWGWDPVENSSLLPWIVAVALVHTFLVQKRTGGLIRTNFLLAIFAFILVIYSTFLTRSGILGDSSVHSFIDPGQIVYLILLCFLGAFLLLGLAVFIFRLKDISALKISFPVNSREFLLSLGAIVLLASTFIILIGTSWPIITSVLGIKKSSVDISYYNMWNMPLIIIILLVNALSFYLNWRSGSYKNAFKLSAISAGIALIATIILFISGVKRFDYVIFAFAISYSLIANIEFLYKTIRSNPKMIGAMISHFGISVFMLGVLGSAVFTESA